MEVKFQVLGVIVVWRKRRTLYSAGFIEHAVWRCVKSNSGNLWRVQLIHRGFSPVLPVMWENNACHFKKTSAGVLLLSQIDIICIWNLRTSTKKLEYKSTYLKKQVHLDNLPRWVQRGSVLAAGLSSSAMPSSAVACSCPEVPLAPVGCGAGQNWQQNPRSQLGLDVIFLAWQAF